MRKLIPLTLALLLSACSVATTEINSQTSTSEEEEIVEAIPKTQWTYTEPEQALINVTKADVEVSAIIVQNIPTTGIPIAKWDDSNICLHVIYSDLSTEDFHFMEKHIPLEFRHFLGEIGHHTLTLAINGVDVSFGFDIVHNPDFHGYNCKFINTRPYEETIVEEVTVGYYQDVTYTGPSYPDVVVDDYTVETFIGWDYPLTLVHQDMEFRNQFRNTEKRFYSRGLMDESGFKTIATYTKDDKHHVLAYLGRTMCVAVNYGETAHHVKGLHTPDLEFGELNPYNEKWNEVNESIYKYGMDYVNIPKYGNVLYGTTGAFSNSTTFLADFEDIYRNEQGEIPSESVLLEDTALVDNSPEANYTNCYETAASYLSYTKEVDSEAETGYYRIAVTMAFDLYISATFKILSQGRYKLEQGTKFVFAPVVSSKRLVLQFSETKEFDAPIKKPLIFTNEMLYNMANNCEW